MQVKTQLSHSSSQEWWKDYDAGNYSGEGFLYLQIWNTTRSPVHQNAANAGQNKFPYQIIHASQLIDHLFR